jgi:hypothetical protein
MTSASASVPSSMRFGLVDLARRQPEVRARSQGEEVREAAGCADLERSVAQASGERRSGTRERGNRGFGAGVRRTRDAETLLVPQVHTRLVADVEPDAEITQELGVSLLESLFARFHRQSVAG